MSKSQLFKKDGLDYKNIYPSNFTENITDKYGNNLQVVLNGYNMYFVSYIKDKATTRKQVPMHLRREGLWITYVESRTVITEWYNSNDITDTAWGLDDNWRDGSNHLIGDISISSDGYWVVNGEKTETQARGEKGIPALMRYSVVDKDSGNGILELSYKDVDHKEWETLVEFKNYVKIEGYVVTEDKLPTDTPQGTMYMQGPNTTPEGNTYYNLYVYAVNSDGILGWQDSGPFTSFNAGVADDKGDSTSLVMTQRATTEYLNNIEARLGQLETAVESIADSLQQESSTIDSLETTVSNLQSKDTELSSNVDTLNSTVSVHEERLDDHSTRIGDIESGIPTIQEKTSALETNLAQEIETRTRKDATINTNINELRGKITELEKEATTESKGLMSVEDKKKLDSLEIINNLTTGGADKALSAEMGKELMKAIGDLSAEMTDYTSTQKRAYIYGNFKSGDVISIYAKGSASVVPQGIVVRYDDVTTTIGYLSINDKPESFTLTKNTNAIVFLLNDNNITQSGTIMITMLCGIKKNIIDLETDLSIAKEIIGNKVDKEEGKNLSTNDFTNDYKNAIESVVGYRNEVVNEYNPIIAYQDIEVSPIVEGSIIESIYVGANGTLFFKDENLNNVQVVANDGIILNAIAGNNLSKVVFPLKVNTTIKYFRLGGTAEDKNVRVVSVFETKGVDEKITQLESEVNKIKDIENNINVELSKFAIRIGTTPMATLVDDDGIILTTTGLGIHTIVKPICDELGIKPTIAVIPNTTTYNINEKSVTQVEYLKERQREGYHITAHPNHTGWYGDNYDLSVVEPALIDCIVYLQQNGFLHSDLLVYPGSSSVIQEVVDIVKKWCQCGIVAGLGNPNHLGDSTKWQIKRTFIDFEACYRAYNGKSGFTNAVDWYKSKIDSAFENGDWIIFGTHSSLITDSEDISNPNVSTKGNLRLVLQYAKSKMSFYTLWDAWNRRKILFDMKEYCQ